MTDYNNCSIYKLCSPHTEKIYIGSTVKRLKRRMQQHKAAFKSYLKGSSVYVSSYDIMKYGDIYIELLQRVSCLNRGQLETIEWRHIRSSPICCNKNKRNEYLSSDPRYQKEYRIKNKQAYLEYQKRYREFRKAELIGYRQGVDLYLSDDFILV